MFDDADVNNDGEIDDDEFKELFSGSKVFSEKA